MNSSQLRRWLFYALILLFASLSFYASMIVPVSNTTEGQVVGTFLLSVGVGAVVALLYSLVRNFSLFSRVSKDVLAFDLRIPVSVISISLALALYYAYHNTGIGWLFIPVPALVIFAILALRGFYPFRGQTKTPSIVPLTDDEVVKFVTSRERLRKLAEYRAKRFDSLLSRAGEIGNPYIISARSLTLTIFSAVVVLPAAVLLAVFVWYPLFLTAFLPALTYTYPEMRLRDRVRERGDGVEKELPFFSILANVLGGAGVPLYSIFTDIADTKIFKFMRREALLIKRDVAVFGMDPIESFDRLASYHPSRKLTTFLYGYTSKVRSGGDIPSYFTGESGTLLRELEESWARYSGSAGLIGSMMITVFGVIPLLLLIVGIFSPSTSVLYLTIFTGIGVPLFAILLIFMAGRMQPVGEDPLVGNARRSAILSLPGLGVGLLSGEVWLGLASSLFIFFTVYGYSVVEQRHEMREIEGALPEFLKDLMEFKRQEYDLTKAVLNIAARNRYTPTFDRTLSRAAAQLKVGTPMDEITVDAKSRLGRMVFFVLGQMGFSGGGTLDTFYQLSTHTTRVIEMKRNTMAEMRPYLYLSFVSPVILAFGVSFISGIISSFGSIIGPGLSTLHGLNQVIGVVTPQLKEISSLLIVISSAALGIIGAKMIDFTIRNTLRASTNILIATVATFLLGQLNIASLVHI